MPAGLSATLDQGGYGGGRIRDVLNASDQERYYRAGPLSALLSVFVIPAIEELAILWPGHPDPQPRSEPDTESSEIALE